MYILPFMIMILVNHRYIDKFKSYNCLLDRVLMIFAYWIVFVSLAMVLLSIPYASAYAIIEQGVEGYSIPSERLPFILFFNATHDDNLNKNAVSKIRLMLYENKTNENVTNVTYAIGLTDFENENSSNSKPPIFNELFYAENGTLTILLSHSDSNDTRVENGYREDVLNAWVVNSIDSDSSSNLLTVSSSEIRENGIYRLNVEIVTIDDKRNFLKSDDVPKIELMLDTGKDFATRVTVVPEFPVGSIILAISISFVIAYAAFLAKRQLRRNC